MTGATITKVQSKSKSTAAKGSSRKRLPKKSERGPRAPAGSMERTRRLLMAALRVWELKRRRLE